MQHRPDKSCALLWNSEAPSRVGQSSLAGSWGCREGKQQSSGPGGKWGTVFHWALIPDRFWGLILVVILPVHLPIVLVHFLSPVPQPSDKWILSLNQPASVLFMHQIIEINTEWSANKGLRPSTKLGHHIRESNFRRGKQKNVKNYTFGGSVSLWSFLSFDSFDSFPFGLLLSSPLWLWQYDLPPPLSHAKKEAGWEPQKWGPGSLLRSALPLDFCPG